MVQTDALASVMSGHWMWPVNEDRFNIVIYGYLGQKFLKLAGNVGNQESIIHHDRALIKPGT